MDFTDEHVARPATARSRMGRFGEGNRQLSWLSQLAAEEQDALLGRGGYGFLVRLGSDGMPEAALMFDPDHREFAPWFRHTALWPAGSDWHE